MHKLFEKTLELLITWLTSTWDSASTQRRILHSQATDHSRLKDSLKLLGISFLLAFFVLLPVYKFSGVNYGNEAFLMPYVIWLIASLLLIVALFHWGLRMFGISSHFSVTLSIYTTTIGVYAPAIAVLNISRYVSIIQTLKEGKKHNDSIFELAERLRDTFQPELFPTLINYANLVVSIVLAVIFCSSISRYYEVTRDKVYFSVAFSAVILIPLIYGSLLAPLYFVLVYFSLQ